MKFKFGFKIRADFEATGRLLKHRHQVVFYAENGNYYTYFEKLIGDLLANTDITITYITSDRNDPLLQHAPPRVEVECVWSSIYHVLSHIETDALIMTVPDLGSTYFFKRSKRVKTYIYIFHAAVSTHQQYNQKAFFEYDTIFCTGEYQQKEIRAAEQLYKSKEKKLIKYGYPLFDAVRAKTSKTPTNTILIAPSWYKGCIFDNGIGQLLNELKETSWKVVLRSHPEFKKRNDKGYRHIEKIALANPMISLDTNTNVLDSIAQSDILITDRSGIAFEYAFGALKPVVFIDTPLKQTNPKWKEIGMDPIENSIRGKMGVCIDPSDIPSIHYKLEDLNKMRPTFGANIQALGSYFFYNSAESYRNGWEYVAGLVNKP